VLASTFPLLDAVVHEAAIAINQTYVAVGEDPTLSDGDEVAIIPPISGG